MIAKRFQFKYLVFFLAAVALFSFASAASCTWWTGSTGLTRDDALCQRVDVGSNCYFQCNGQRLTQVAGGPSGLDSIQFGFSGNTFFWKYADVFSSPASYSGLFSNSITGDSSSIKPLSAWEYCPNFGSTCIELSNFRVESSRPNRAVWERCRIITPNDFCRYQYSCGSVPNWSGSGDVTCGAPATLPGNYGDYCNTGFNESVSASVSGDSVNWSITNDSTGGLVRSGSTCVSSCGATAGTSLVCISGDLVLQNSCNYRERTTDCGANTYGDWGAPYCKPGSPSQIFRSRDGTCRGCDSRGGGPACFSEACTDEGVLENCGTGRCDASGGTPVCNDPPVLSPQTININMNSGWQSTNLDQWVADELCSSGICNASLTYELLNENVNQVDCEISGHDLRHKPADDWPNANSANATCRVRVTDELGLQDAKNVTINVDNRAPDFADFSLFAQKNAPEATENLLSHVTDDAINKSTIVFSVVSQNPSQVRCQINAGSQVLRYTPAADWTGSATCTLRARDNGNQTDNATVTINVSEIPNDPPDVSIDQPNDGAVFTTANLPITFSGTVTDPEGQSFNSIWSSSIDGTFGPNALFVAPSEVQSLGTHTITLIATDELGASGSDSISITINAVPTPQSCALLPSSSSLVGAGDSEDFTAFCYSSPVPSFGAEISCPQLTWQINGTDNGDLGNPPSGNTYTSPAGGVPIVMFTANSTIGSSQLDVSASTPFSCSATVTTSPGYDADCVSTSVPSTMVAGSTAAVYVTMRNTGANNWSPASNFWLRYVDYYDPIGSPHAPNNWNNLTVPLPSPVDSGDPVTFSFTITAPSAAGTYHFYWRMAGTSPGIFGNACNTDTIVVTPSANNVPTVNAGPDKTTTVGAPAITLNGSANDTDGTIASLEWSIVSNPANCSFSSQTPSGIGTANAANDLQISCTSTGTATFRLTATDDDAATVFDEAVVTVNPAAGPSADVWVVDVLLFYPDPSNPTNTFVGVPITGTTTIANVSSSTETANYTVKLVDAITEEAILGFISTGSVPIAAGGFSDVPISWAAPEEKYKVIAIVDPAPAETVLSNNRVSVRATIVSSNATAIPETSVLLVPLIALVVLAIISRK